MGANRLASNSLLECLVFGFRASEEAARLKLIRCSTGELLPFDISPEHEQTFLDLKNEMAELMTTHLGIIRNKQKWSFPCRDLRKSRPVPAIRHRIIIC